MMSDVHYDVLYGKPGPFGSTKPYPRGTGMSEMVERVARVICIANKYDPNAVWSINDPPEGGSASFDLAIPAWRQTRFISGARAVIAAMREPTDVMEGAAYDAGLDIYWSYHADGRPGEAKDVWHSMIDAALK